MGARSHNTCTHTRTYTYTQVADVSRGGLGGLDVTVEYQWLRNEWCPILTCVMSHT